MIAIIIIIPIINNVLVTKRDSGNVVLLCFWYEPFCHRHYYCQHHQIITTIIIIPKINTVLVTEFDSGKAPTLHHQKASALHLNARGQRLDSNYEYLWLSSSDYLTYIVIISMWLLSYLWSGTLRSRTNLSIQTFVVSKNAWDQKCMWLRLRQSRAQWRMV